MKFRKWISISLGAALLMSILNGCGASQTTPNHDSAADKGGIRSAAPASPSGSNAASLRTPAALDLTGATIITLSGSTVSIEGSGAEAEGGVVTITEGGIYAVSGTLDDGRIIVNAGSADVTVALNGASIVCSYGSPLYIYQAGTATVHLMEGTENTLTDGESYTFSDSLSSAADEMNQVMALSMGADDFIAKPFGMELATAKIGAVLRRAYDLPATSSQLHAGGAVLDLQEAALLYVGEKLSLSKNEFLILRILFEHKNSPVSREELIRALWNDESFIDDNTLTVNIARIRKKLEEAGLRDFIRTRKGLGYLIEEKEHD